MPVAIVYGALRSGSTLLRLMLDGHSAISCTGEHDFIFEHLHQTSSGWRLDIDELRHDRVFRAQNLQVPDTDDGQKAVSQLIGQISAIGGKTTSVLMLHRGLAKAAELLPKAAVIHLLRDPRDVARSWVGMGWQGNVYRAVDGWMKTEQDWDAVSGDIKFPVLELRYEELVANPEIELTRVCSFLSTSYEQAMMSYPSTTSYDAPDARLAEQWRKKMPPLDQQLAEARLGPLLAARGYKASGQPRLNVTNLRRIFLGLESAYGRWRHLIKHNGYLPIQRTVGRRLRLSSVERSAQRRIDAIMQDRYLK